MQLLSDRVAIIVDAQEEQENKVNGIILTVQQEPQKKTTGTVAFTGPGRVLQDGTTQPMAVAEGQRVVFNAFAGTNITENDQPYLVLREADIIAII